MRPSARPTIDGYQRPRAMSCTWMNFSVAGSKTVVVLSPPQPWPLTGYCSVPPAMSARPSGIQDRPLQKRSHGTSCTSITPVFGSKTAALFVVTVGSFCVPLTMRILPVRMRPTWIGLIGIV